MAIRGSSLDPVQQALDTANAMGSVSASNKEVKDSLNRLQATLIDISKKNENNAKQLKASLDRATETLSAYFKGQQSSDLIKKSNVQIETTKALMSSSSDDKYDSSEQEVENFVKKSDEITGHLKDAAITFSDSFKKLLDLFDNQKDILSGTDIIKKVTENIKSGKIDGLNSFSKITGIDIRGVDKSVIAPLVSELITAVKKGQSIEQAVNFDASKKSNSEKQTDNISEEQAVNFDASKKSNSEKQTDNISEEEFRKAVLKFLKEDGKNTKKNIKESEVRHRNLKELLEEGNRWSKINVLAQIPSILNNLGTMAAWGVIIAGIWSAVTDFWNAYRAARSISDDEIKRARERNQNVAASKMYEDMTNSMLKGKSPQKKIVIKKNAEELPNIAKKGGDDTIVATQQRLQNAVMLKRSGKGDATTDATIKALTEQLNTYLDAYKVRMAKRFAEVVEKLRDNAYNSICATMSVERAKQIDDVYRRDHPVKAWMPGHSLATLRANARSGYAAVSSIGAQISEQLRAEYESGQKNQKTFLGVSAYHSFMVDKAVTIYNNFIAWAAKERTLQSHSDMAKRGLRIAYRGGQQEAINIGRAEIQDMGFSSDDEKMFGPGTVAAAKQMAAKRYRPNTFSRSSYQGKISEDYDIHDFWDLSARLYPAVAPWNLPFNLIDPSDPQNPIQKGDKVPTDRYERGYTPSESESIRKYLDDIFELSPDVRDKYLKEVLPPHEYAAYIRATKAKNGGVLSRMLLESLLLRKPSDPMPSKNELKVMYDYYKSRDSFLNRHSLPISFWKDITGLDPRSSFLESLRSDEQAVNRMLGKTDPDIPAAGEANEAAGMVVELLKDIRNNTATPPPSKGEVRHEPPPQPPATRR